MSDDRDPWFEDQYQAAEVPPAHLTRAIRETAHAAVRQRRFARWYTAGTAASLFVAVTLYFTVIQDSPVQVVHPSASMTDALEVPGDKATAHSLARQPASPVPAGEHLERSAEPAETMENTRAVAEQSPVLVRPARPARPEERRDEIEEVIVTGSYIRRDNLPRASDEAAPGELFSKATETGPMETALPVCSDLDQPSGPTPCYLDQSEQRLSVWMPGDHGCPRLLDVGLALPLEAPTVITRGNPPEVTVMGRHFLCRDGAWHRRDSDP
ncbi:MAG: hypothetical protein O2868_13010 [Proteobacteria bacterium]|jgi:hypothetical protein|nr:hypothetical protein [Pseudomonadota bacterium]